MNYELLPDGRVRVHSKTGEGAILIGADGSQSKGIFFFSLRVTRKCVLTPFRPTTAPTQHATGSPLRAKGTGVTTTKVGMGRRAHSPKLPVFYYYVPILFTFQILEHRERGSTPRSLVPCLPTALGSKRGGLFPSPSFFANSTNARRGRRSFAVCLSKKHEEGRQTLSSRRLPQ